MKVKYVMLFIIVLLACSSIVYAITVSSSDVTYDNSESHLKDDNDQDVDNVKDAIDILYSRINSGSGQYSGNENVVIKNMSITANTIYDNKIAINENTSRVQIDCVGVTNYTYPSHMEWSLINGYSKSSSVSSAQGSDGVIFVDNGILTFKIAYVVSSVPVTDNCTVNIS